MKSLLLLFLPALLTGVTSLRAQSTGMDGIRNDSLQAVPRYDSVCGCTTVSYTTVLTASEARSSDVGYDRCLEWLKKAYRADRLYTDTAEKQRGLIVAHPTIPAYTKAGLIRTQTPVLFTLRIEIAAGGIRIRWGDHYIMMDATKRPYKVPVPYEYKAPNAWTETLLQAVRAAIIEDHQQAIAGLRRAI